MLGTWVGSRSNASLKLWREWMSCPGMFCRARPRECLQTGNPKSDLAYKLVSRAVSLKNNPCSLGPCASRSPRLARRWLHLQRLRRRWLSQTRKCGLPANRQIQHHTSPGRHLPGKSLDNLARHISASSNQRTSEAPRMTKASTRARAKCCVPGRAGRQIARAVQVVCPNDVGHTHLLRDQKR